MRVLVWSPHLNAGGGVRLLCHLVPAIAGDPRVDQVCWASGGEAPRTESLEGGHGQLRLVSLTSARVAGWLDGPSVLRLLRGRRRVQRYLVRYAKAGPLAISQGRELERLVRRADVVYAPWPHRLEPPCVPTRLVCTIQDTILIDYPEILGGAEAAAERNRTAAWIRRSDRVVVSSEATRQALRRLFDGQLSRMTLVPHAIAPRSPTPVGWPPPGLPQRYAACLTNITVHKNLDTLLVAWSRFEARVEMPLVVTGQGTQILDGCHSFADAQDPREAHLLGLAHRLGLVLGRDILALGYIPDDQVMPLVRGADMLINPSLSEGGGSFPAEEALSCGVPVLCSDIPVMREHLAERRAVVWFDPLSIEAILAALRRFVQDVPRYRLLAQADAAQPRPTWAQIAARYVDEFEAVLKEQGRGG